MHDKTALYDSNKIANWNHSFIDTNQSKKKFQSYNINLNRKSTSTKNLLPKIDIIVTSYNVSCAEDPS